MATAVAEGYDGELDAAEDSMPVTGILRSLPRPLMPLLEFLYRSAKYSQSSLSWMDTDWPCCTFLNLLVRY